ncbi:MAG: tRNA pseudouridine(13) synthase TruD [Planctomycetota bacterium]
MPPVAFRTREELEDFRVWELPSIEPCGEGTHLFLTVEKRGIPTTEAARRLARALDLQPAQVGFAGRKDARAVTVQRMSVEHVDESRVRGLELPGLRVLHVVRHSRKLRLGQLRGNRFEILLRGLDAADREHLEQALELLQRHGLPNHFGFQRFGRNGLAHELGRLLIQRRPADYLRALASPTHAGDDPAAGELALALAQDTRAAHRRSARLVPRLESELAAVARQLARRPGDWDSAVRAVSKRTRRFHLSALQSRVFQTVLVARMERGPSLDCLAVGDLPWSQDAEVPTGPLPGARGPLAQGAPGDVERAALAAEGLELTDFAGLPGGLDPAGARRPLRVPLTELEIDPGREHCAQGVRLRFCLPPGSFATTLLEELAKLYARVS